jgi:hypothetical protein
MHHAKEFGIELPENFDMTKYDSLDNPGRVEYTKKHVPRDTVIRYQNEIGKSMCPIFNIRGRTTSVPGFAGVFKTPTELQIEHRIDGRIMINVIREDGKHISSYSTNEKGLAKLIKNNFWVFRNRYL